MHRKFYTPYTALIGNYSANQNVNQFQLIGGVWTEGALINAPPSGTNLLSMSIGAATIGNARCLKTAYQNNELVPITCTNGIWSVGSPITLASSSGSSPSSVSTSLDGMHALTACDNSANVDAVMYNTSTGLWQANGSVSLVANLTNVAITPDGTRGICIPKASSNAYPLTRNPITNVWSVGSPIVLGSGNTRFFCSAFSPDGSVCLIGSNASGTNGDALIWNGSSYTRISVPFIFAGCRWFSDGKTVLTVSGDTGNSNSLLLSYNPNTQTFSLIQTITYGMGTIGGVAIPELGRQDIAIVTSFTQNKLIPLANVGGTWSAGTPVTSANFSSPIAAVIMPVV